MKTIFGAASLAALLLSGTALAGTPASCQLGNGIKHVVYLQFDNTHFQRDFSNVPSDLEQMPHLLSFIKQNGVLLSNDHTQLISHTANGIITSETGVYSDRSGAGAIANSFNFYNGAGTGAYNASGVNAAAYSSSFVYWTNKLTGTADTSYILQNENGQNAPAPWVSYTRAGCDVGAVGIADIDLENVTTDLQTVFGPTSAEYKLSGTGKKTAYFEGIAVHCASGSAVCAAANALSGSTLSDGLPVSKAVTDALPQEPNGYTGYNAIFGARYAYPALQSLLGQTPNGQFYDYQGNLIGYQTATGGQIVQAQTISGFPGFSGMYPFVTLALAENMLKAGVPVVYGYFNDAHDHSYGTQDGVNPAGTTFAYGPGEQGYVNQLKQYDAAWVTFFANLKAAGIDQTNTLFVILVEEGDKFAGGKPVPANCDGIHIACTYPPNVNTQYGAASVAAGNNDKGEVDINVDQLLATEFNDSTVFSTHTDMAPAFYVNGNPANTDATLRQLEKHVLGLTYQDPYLTNTKTFTVPMVTAIADPVELAALHMVTADPLRTPSFVAFDYADVYAGIAATTSGSANPNCNGLAVCTYQGYAWNHGGNAAVVRQTWTSFTGPGVNNAGIDGHTWTDHTDVRATMMALLGLHDDYLHDGRVITEDLNTAALPSTITSNLAKYNQLAKIYKQLTAPFGEAGTASLSYATSAIGSTSNGDATYLNYVTTMNSWVANRNTVAAAIRVVLNNAETGTAAVSNATANPLISQATALIQQIDALGGTGH